MRKYSEPVMLATSLCLERSLRDHAPILSFNMILSFLAPYLCLGPHVISKCLAAELRVSNNTRTYITKGS